MELTYRKAGEYLIPNLEVPESPKVGKYGMLRCSYLLDFLLQRPLNQIILFRQSRKPDIYIQLLRFFRRHPKGDSFISPAILSSQINTTLYGLKEEGVGG